MPSAAFSSADAVLADLPPRSLVYVAGGVGTPQLLVDALCRAAVSRGPFTVITSVMGPLPPFCGPQHADVFTVKTFRATRELGPALVSGQTDVVPTHLSRIPQLLRGPLRPDVALVQTSTPRHGIASMGCSVLYHRAAMDAARLVIAEMNDRVPWTLGDAIVDVQELHRTVRSDMPVMTFGRSAANERELAVAAKVAALVPDHAVVQLGIGGIPDRVCSLLRERRDLRLHAGLLPDGVMDLVDAGAVRDEPGSIVSGGFIGSDTLYRWAHENRLVCMRRVEHTHDLAVISGYPRFVAINGALQVDLSGQVNAESMGGVLISGTGGHTDFMRGAAASDGGLSIIALTSTTSAGDRSRIVPCLTAPATTLGTDVGLVVTEHGVADLRGRSLRERRDLLLGVADPRYRGTLE